MFAPVVKIETISLVIAIVNFKALFASLETIKLYKWSVENVQHIQMQCCRDTIES